MGDGDGVGTDMAVESETDLNADPTGQFVIQGEKRGAGHNWTCKCCEGKFIGHKQQGCTDRLYRLTCG